MRGRIQVFRTRVLFFSREKKYPGSKNLYSPTYPALLNLGYSVDTCGLLGLWSRILGLCSIIENFANFVSCHTKNADSWSSHSRNTSSSTIFDLRSTLQFILKNDWPIITAISPVCNSPGHGAQGTFPPTAHKDLVSRFQMALSQHRLF